MGTLARATTYGLTPVLALATMNGLQQGEQQAVSLSLSGMKHDFHTTDFVLGFLPVAIAVVALGAGFPFGRLTDRSRRVFLLVAASLAWTFFIGLASLSVSLLMLFAARMGLGAIEASSMAGLSLIGDYYPVQVRAKRIGLWTAGSLVGAALAIGLGGTLVDQFGWRAAAWMWVPFGLASAAFLWRQPEPARGTQDAEFLDASAHHDLPAHLELPEPTRVADCDYSDAMSWREVLQECNRIRSFWLVTVGVMMGNLVQNGVAYWGIEYFKRFHHLSNAAAGGVAALIGIGSGLGIVVSGWWADRRLRGGDLNGRLNVAVIGCVIGTIFMPLPWLVPDLALSAPLFVLGGFGLTLPFAVIDTVLTDITPAELRGRAIVVRSVVRALSQVGPALVGLLSVLTDLQTALTLFCPLYAFAIIALARARKHYPDDLAFACAESKRLLVVT